MRKTGEILAVDFLLCHWKSEPRGRTLFDFVVPVLICQSERSHTYTSTHT